MSDLDIDEAALEDYVPYVPVKQRKQQQIERLKSQWHQRSASSDEEDARSKRQRNSTSDAPASPQIGPTAKVSLMEQVKEMKKTEKPKTEAELQLEEERRLLESMAQRKKLQSAHELAQDIRYTEPMKTSWQPPSYIKALSPADVEERRRKWRIMVEGDDVPAPIGTFAEMKLPQSVLDYLKSKHIRIPTPIQMQGLPVAFSGRDMCGISYTGSGKSLAFTLPMVMFALEAEMKLPLIGGEGPIGVVLGPSRELARQTYDLAKDLASAIERQGGPELRVLLCIGGIDMREQYDRLKRGVHMIVATPGRLQHLLNSKRINFDNCRYLCMDEADRMVDFGFEEDIRNILSYFKHQRQTVLFSATMPAKVQEFAATALVKPVTVNVGRAGAANLDVVQHVEYVPKEARILYLLECLQKTAPPVLIFAENKADVDDIQEFLLLKGVEAVAIHGGKDQAEREYAITSFRAGKKDVLIATDLASKGLDFPDIQHVINFDLPREIEDYVHRIGRTGRGGKTGIATTFINSDCKEQVLRDLKALLVEAKQAVHQYLQSLEDPFGSIAEYERRMAGQAEGKVPAGQGCAFCGGLGHRVTECPKLEHQRKMVQGGRRMDAGGSGGF